MGTKVEVSYLFTTLTCVELVYIFCERLMHSDPVAHIAHKMCKFLGCM